MFFNWEFGDPGPCPVDDAPHTTCTSPDYALKERMLAAGSPALPVIVRVRRPWGLGRVEGPPAQSSSVPISTKTYRGRGKP